MLEVSLMRLLRSHVFCLKNRYVTSVLLDVKQFYECISYPDLMQSAEEMQFPPMLLNFALQAYTGRRVLIGEGMASSPVWAQQGILAGCPIAPVLAKIIMAPTFRQFKQQLEPLHCDVWVDDISVDLTADTPGALVLVKNCHPHHPQCGGQLRRRDLQR